MRLWYIKCILPLPRRDGPGLDPKVAGKVLVGGLTAMAGPIAGMTAALFSDMYEMAANKLDSDLPYRVEDQNRKLSTFRKEWVFLKNSEGWTWMRTPMKATSYPTREAAETDAFTFFAICPWFFGKLEIVSMRATWLSS